MTAPIIRAEGLGKMYTLGPAAEREPYTALRDVLGRSARGLGRRALDLTRGRAAPRKLRAEPFWALQDVNFEIGRGEVVGVIGRNGAGKSTLLKILSRITEPSQGRVTINGRVASLLEVGTGFHPELTGRENIYLNGAILGMTRGEIRRKFDEIVNFAAVERFIDTPVKRYSSGMQVRLAFSVAAHLEPEILVVDEVLAVGDAEFQKKCLGKMDEVAAREGRTVLFVSHQLGMVSRLCTRGILLSAGRIAFDGPTDAAIDLHLAGIAQREAEDELDLARHGNLDIAIVRVAIEDPNGAPVDQLAWDQSLKICVRLSFRKPVAGQVLVIALESQRGERVATWPLALEGQVRPGAETADFTLDVAPGRVAPGGYSFVVAVVVPHVSILQLIQPVCPFVVIDTGAEMTAMTGIDYGVSLIPAAWSVVSDQAAGQAPVRSVAE
ncbi:MAG TPA: ABC transporter ATP-binding protein [Caulobacteraceae bacterium]|jgi:lipopolysaccharide transport system ATP-binding protein|nr:ABC transporter ATP-binding protein [Caulobacteraceae bacterium]